MMFAVLLLMLWPGVAWASGAPELIPILEQGPAATRVNVVFLSEGYTRAELPQFEMDAALLAGDIMRTHPFQAYSNYFNVYAIAVASAESGSDHPSQGIFRDIYWRHEGGWELEEREPSAPHGKWAPVPAAVVQEEGMNQVLLPFSNSARLFRLRRGN